MNSNSPNFVASEVLEFECEVSGSDQRQIPVPQFLRSRFETLADQYLNEFFIGG